MILLDTNALFWLERGHPRARALERRTGRLYVSPAALLELQFLIELGRLRLRRTAAISDLADDPRWLVDDPPSLAWFAAARAVGWTRDPFDRLLVAHAQLRGWSLATADSRILAHLGADLTLELQQR